MNGHDEPPPALARLVERMQRAGAGELERRSRGARLSRALRAPLGILLRGLGALAMALVRIGLLIALTAGAVPAALFCGVRRLRPSTPRDGRYTVCGAFAPFAHAGVAVDLLRWVIGRQQTVRLFAPLLHRIAPVVELPAKLRPHLFGLTFVLSYDDVAETLGNHGALRVSTYDARMTRTSGPFLLGHDGPQHAQSRVQTADEVRDGRHDQDGPRVTALARAAAEALLAVAAARSTPSIDVVSELGNVVPLYVAREYFGIEDTDDEQLLPLLQTMSFYLFNFWIGGPYEVRAIEAAARLRLHLRAAIEARLRAMPDVPDDVLQRVIKRVQESSPGQPLSEQAKDAVASHLLGLLSGSIVATVGTFLNATRALLELPSARRAELARACRGEAPPEQLDHWVSEACRLGGAFPPMLYRVAATDVALAPGKPHTHAVARGSYVVSAQWLANFDPSKYPMAWRLQPERFARKTPAPPPLLFGFGVHRCLAEHLGQAMIREMIRALFARSNVRPAPGADGKLQNGQAGVIPDGNFARRLVLRFDV